MMMFSCLTALRRRPDAHAILRGSEEYPELCGMVRFYQTGQGVLMLAEVRGLPQGSGPCGGRVFGFHIHEGDACTGNAADPFADTGGHENPGDCDHPHHAGDLPPLFENRGTALLLFLSHRFTVREVLGKTVIIHGQPDDFTTQPSGHTGEKIACGKIVRG